MNKKYFRQSEVLFDNIKNYNSESAKDNFSKIINHSDSITEEIYEIKSEEESKFFNKQFGIYKLLTIPDILYLNSYSQIIEILTNMLKDSIGKIKKTDRILIVGLGNRHISSDSLGYKVISNIDINISDKNKPKVMAFCPSVLGLTGIETYDTIKGVTDRVKPTHLILIDSLCASSIERLGKSIQISNTGICPGSGIGNNQKCIDKSFAKNVFSIGIPLLIYASTFIQNAFEMENINLSTLNNTMQKLKKLEYKDDFLKVINAIKRIYLNNLEDVIVSIKDIEDCTKALGKIVAQAINNTIYDN